jgi:C4-type Zn-finger protein
MTIPELEARIASHTAAKAQAISTVHALEGAIQEAQHWIEQLKAAQEPTND